MRRSRGSASRGVVPHLVLAPEQDAAGRVKLVDLVERHLVLAAPGASSGSSGSRGVEPHLVLAAEQNAAGRVELVVSPRPGPS
jgi:hypothetical protein